MMYSKPCWQPTTSGVQDDTNGVNFKYALTVVVGDAFLGNGHWGSSQSPGWKYPEYYPQTAADDLDL